MSPKFWLPLLGLLLLAFGAGSTWYFSDSRNPSSENCETPGNQEGWCRSENKEAGYSVEYPAGWYVDSGIITNFAPVDLATATKEEAAWKDWYFKADIVTLEDFSGGSLKDWVKAQNDESWNSLYRGMERPPENYSELSISGNPVVKHTLSDGPWGDVYSYYIGKDGKVFTIACSFTSEDLRTYCDSIVLSFK